MVQDLFTLKINFEPLVIIYTCLYFILDFTTLKMSSFGDLFKCLNIKKKLKKKKNKKNDKNQENRIEKYSRDLSDGQVTDSCNRNQQNRIEKYSRDLSD